MAINSLKWLPNRWADLSRLESNKGGYIIQSTDSFDCFDVTKLTYQGFTFKSVFRSQSFAQKPEEASLKSARNS